jgi:hypothetical protein
VTTRFPKVTSNGRNLRKIPYLGRQEARLNGRIKDVNRVGTVGKFMQADAGEDFDLPALATKLVQLEIDDPPGNVGPPISEVRLDKDGVTWISNDAGCPVAAR